jgi:hypothetical protein
MAVLMGVPTKRAATVWWPPAFMFMRLDCPSKDGGALCDPHRVALLVDLLMRDPVEDYETPSMKCAITAEVM